MMEVEQSLAKLVSTHKHVSEDVEDLVDVVVLSVPETSETREWLSDVQKKVEAMKNILNELPCNKNNMFEHIYETEAELCRLSASKSSESGKGPWFF